MNATSSSLCNRFVRRVRAMVLAVCLAVGLGPLMTAPAHGQFAVACVNCSSIIQQILEYATQISEFATQVSQYQTQIRQYQNMVQNSVKLEYWLGDEALQAIRNVENVLREGTNITYALMDLDRRFRETYPDFRSIYQQSEFFDFAENFNRHVTHSKRVFDSAKTALEAAQRMSQGMQTEQTRMDQLGMELTTASGHLDAIQAAGQLTQHTAQQMMRMRQLAMLQLQLQATTIAEDQRLRDEDRAAITRWLATRPNPVVDTPVDTFLPGARP